MYLGRLARSRPLPTSMLGLSRRALVAGGPALALDFTTGTLDPRITFTRASSGTYFDSNGVMQTAGNNEPRSNHRFNGTIWESAGLLIEPTATNLLTRSSEFNSWTKVNTTVTENALAGVDGTATMDLVTEGTAGNASLSRTATITADGTVTEAFDMMRGNHDWVQTTVFETASTANFIRGWFNLATGAVGTATNGGTGSGATASIENFGGGKYRCILTGAIGNSATAVTARTRSAASSGSISLVNNATRYMDRAQLEAGSEATSYIATGASTDNRDGDVAIVAGGNFDSWFNPVAGTFCIRARSPATGTRIVFQADDGTADNRYTLYTSGTDLKFDVVAGGVTQASLTLGTITANTAFDAAVAFAANSIAGVVDSGAVQTDTSATLPAVNRLRLGSDTTGNFLGEHIERMWFYPTRVADIPLQTLIPSQRATWQSRINVWKANPSLTALSHDDAVEEGEAARAAAAAILTTINAIPRNKTVFADPSASGANNGTSWANAYTSLATAIGALVPGDLLLTNSTEADPFTDTGNISSAASYIEWQTDQGADGETWITGALRATWTDEGGNVFSTALATAPYGVAYDFKRDDDEGTVTGIDLTATKVSQALDANLTDTPWGTADAVAWYGALKEAAAPTTTPAAGEWSHTGGMLYINPPVATDAATCATLAIYADSRSAFQMGATINDWHISGKLTTFFTPSDDGGGGYGMRFTAATRVVIQGTRCILSGYHSIGCAGTSGAGNIFLDHLTVGHRSIPLVFYAGGDSLPDAGHRTDRCTVLGFGLLTADGTPVNADHQSQFTYSHAGGSNVLGGITYARSVMLDFTGQITANSGVANATVATGPLWAENVGGSPDATDPDSFAVRFAGLVFLGKQALPPSRCRVTGYHIDGLGYGSGSETQFSSATAGATGNTAWVWLLEDGLWLPPVVNRCITAIAADDYIRINNSVVNVRSNFLLQSTALNPTAIQIKDSLFDGNKIAQVNATVWAATDRNFESYGGNIIAPTIAVQHTNGISNFTSAQLVAGMGSDPTDFAATALDWTGL